MTVINQGYLSNHTNINIQRLFLTCCVVPPTFTSHKHPASFVFMYLCHLVLPFCYCQQLYSRPFIFLLIYLFLRHSVPGLETGPHPVVLLSGVVCSAPPAVVLRVRPSLCQEAINTLYTCNAGGYGGAGHKDEDQSASFFMAFFQQTL